MTCDITFISFENVECLKCGYSEHSSDRPSCWSHLHRPILLNDTGKPIEAGELYRAMSRFVEDKEKAENG